MKDRLSTHTQLELSRRDMLGGLAAAAGAAGLASGPAQAATGVIRAYGVTTAQLKDWSTMTKSTGLRMEFTPAAGNDVGVLLREVIASDIGKTADLVLFGGGPHNILGPMGKYAVLDQGNPQLTLWDRTPDLWKKSPVVVAKDGKTYGVPITGNADSFGYFPDKIGVDPDGSEDISWRMLLDDDRTRGRAAFDRTWNYSSTTTALYLKASGKAKIDNPAELTPAEARTVVDFLVARKKAGQFRTLVSSFEEQVQLLTRREVDVLNCWEPAVKLANGKLDGAPVRYAYTVEGYLKWGHGAYVTAQAAARGNVDGVYKTLNYFLGGEYRAYQARDRGYGGPNIDLAVDYAKRNGWSEADIAGLQAVEAKIERKYKKPFVSTYAPANAEAIESEWQRFLNA